MTLFLLGSTTGYGGSETSQHKIVSLSPAITAMVCELDQADTLVGVTRYCQVPADLKTPPQVVGGAVDPEVESILSLAPDIVLASSLLPGNIENRLGALGIKVKRFRQDTIRDILDQVLWLGTYLGNPEKAQSEVAQAEAAMARAQSLIRESRATAILTFSEKLELIAGGNTYASEVMNLAGLQNMAATLGQSWPTVSHEWLLAENPDWILLATHRPAAEVATIREKSLDYWQQHRTLSQLSAVQNEQVLVIPDNQFGVPSLRIFQVIETIRVACELAATQQGGAHAQD